MKYPIAFGKYLLLERINIGGMAEVFKAKTFGVEGFERFLAIKRILPNMAEDAEFINMFIDEARIAVQLTHANIVQIYELGKHEGQYYIAMEYVAGRDLRKILDGYRKRKETIPIPQAAYVASKMCEGLDHAHRKRDPTGKELKIIHRDVSPQNVLLSYDGEIKLIDFGIAKAANRASKTQAGVLKGKFGYMSPEQVRGLPIDHRSDIFAVGVLLYEMLTGQRLFLGESDFSTLEKVRAAEVPPPSQFAELPPDLEAIMMKALAREAGERYQWASEFHDELQRFLIVDNTIFNAKRLSLFMRKQYARDIEDERKKMEEFIRVQAPPQMTEHAGMLDAGGGGASPGPDMFSEKTMIFETAYEDDLANAATVIGLSGEEIQAQLDALRAGAGGAGPPSDPRAGGAQQPFSASRARPAEDHRRNGGHDGSGVRGPPSEPRAERTREPPPQRAQQRPRPENTGGATSVSSNVARRRKSGGWIYVVLGSALAAAVIGLVAVILLVTRAERQLAELVVYMTNAAPNTVLSVYVDNRIMHSGPPQAVVKGIPAGQHMVLMRAIGYNDALFQVDFQPGKQVNLQVPMQPGVAGSASANVAPPPGQGYGAQPAPDPAAAPAAPDPGAGAAPAPAEAAPAPPGAPEGNVEVKSMPPGATVMLGRQSLGVTPMKVTGLDVGKIHTLTLKKQGFQEHTARVVFVNGVAQAVVATLTPGREEARQEPPPREEQAETPKVASAPAPKREDPPPRAETKPEPRAEAPKPKPEPEPKREAAKPAPAPKKDDEGDFGYLVANVKGAFCTIEEKGVVIGNTPVPSKAPLKLKAGKHTLKFVAPDGRSVTETITITAGDTLKVITSLK